MPAFPNPFNPETKIRYLLPQDSRVTLHVYNTLGELVKVLVNESKKAGQHEIHWDGTNEGGYRVSSGVYLYRIQANSFFDVKKVLLVN